MTTIKDIELDIETLKNMLIKKGWKGPICSANFEPKCGFGLIARNPVEGGEMLSEYNVGYGKPYGDAFRAAVELIHSLPNSEDAAMDNFRKGLGALIDKGNALGIDAKFLNPLIEQMRALSENAITKGSTK